MSKNTPSIRPSRSEAKSLLSRRSGTSISANPVLQKIGLLQSKINKLRSLKPDLISTLQEKLRVEWTYNSNAIEGNTLTLGETMFFLREGLTSEGKPLKDYLEAKNHAEAIDGLYEIIQGERDLSESLIKELHGILMKGIEFTYAKTPSGQTVRKPFHAGQYKLQPNHVLTLSGKIHSYTEPLKVKDEMEKLVKWYYGEQALHAVEKAAIFHYRFVAIHPFDDGNGRIARLLMNLILMKNGYPPCIIQNAHRRKYLETLSRVDIKHDYVPFIIWIGEELLSTQEQIYNILIGKNSPINVKKINKNTPPTINEFQRKSLIVKILKNNNTFSIGQILEHLPSVKRPTLKSDLKRLVEAGKIKKKGLGKGVVYFVNRHQKRQE